jgi:hypothetical protein
LIIQIHNSKSPQSKDMAADLWAWFATRADRAFMAFYAHVRKNANRIMRLVIAFLPLMMLLVGSCKTSELPGSYGSNAGPDQFRIALFPDRVNFTGGDYYPAQGYISRARKYVEGAPDALTQLTEQEISYLFGAPTVERRDADARIWQYRGDACVLDVYFYKDASRDKGYSVTYVDFRMKEDMDPALQAEEMTPASTGNQSRCIRTLVRAGAQPPIRA